MEATPARPVAGVRDLGLQADEEPDRTLKDALLLPPVDGGIREYSYRHPAEVGFRPDEVCKGIQDLPT